jgi:hypothetical protein
MKTVRRLMAVVMAVGLLAPNYSNGGARASANEALPSARLDVKIAEATLVGRPVLIEVTVANSGSAPISYWWGGPGKYPNAERFRVALTSNEGKTQEVVPSNGQYVEGSGGDLKIAPGESIKVPLAIPALAAGKWTLQVSCVEERSFSEKAGGARHVNWPAVDKTAGGVFTVKDDAQARERWDKEVLARIRGGTDVFSQHVASCYRIMGVLMPLLGDLSGSDDKAALLAVNTLFQTQTLPLDTDKAVRKAVAAQLKRDAYKANLNLLACLMGLAGHQPSDRMLEAVLAVAHSDLYSPGDEILDHAVRALRYFPQNKSQEELRHFLTDKRQRVREAAKNAIEHPWPPRNSAQASADTVPK